MFPSIDRVFETRDRISTVTEATSLTEPRFETIYRGRRHQGFRFSSGSAHLKPLGGTFFDPGVYFYTPAPGARSQ